MTEKQQMYLSFLKEEGIDVVNYNSDKISFKLDGITYIIDLTTSDIIFTIFSAIPMKNIKNKNVLLKIKPMPTIKGLEYDDKIYIFSENLVAEPTKFKEIFYVVVCAVKNALKNIYENDDTTYCKQNTD